MSQFTVYRNKNGRTKTLFPYLLDVQSDLLEDLHTCVVIPLARTGPLTKKPVGHLTPILKVDGEPHMLMTPELAAISRNELGAATSSLADRRDVILAAMDFLVTGF